MKVMIGIDPHKASHTAVAIDGDEDQLSSVKVRATGRQVDQLMRLGRAIREAHVGHRVGRRDGLSAGPTARRRGEDVLDVPATLASRIRVLGTERSNKNDPNDAQSVAIAALRSPRLRRSSRPTMPRCCASWPSATTTSGAIGPGSSVASTPCSPSSLRAELPRNSTFLTPKRCSRTEPTDPGRADALRPGPRAARRCAAARCADQGVAPADPGWPSRRRGRR